MKITDIKATPLQPSGPDAKGGKQAGPTTGPVDGAPIRLSGLGGQLAHLETELASSPSFDAARVAEVRQAIVEGRYRVDAEAIADRLLAGAADFLRRPH